MYVLTVIHTFESAVISMFLSFLTAKPSLNLMKILAHSEKDIQRGNIIRQETLFKQIEDKLLKRKLANKS